jgi:hypothetical protein
MREILAPRYIWPLVLFVLINLVGMVWASDKGGPTEVGLLQGSVSQCDAMYHAIWRVQDEPSHSTLISTALSMGCPMEDN